VPTHFTMNSAPPADLPYAQNIDPEPDLKIIRNVNNSGEF
jgi:hypothetical protein